MCGLLTQGKRKNLNRERGENSKKFQFCICIQESMPNFFFLTFEISCLSLGFNLLLTTDLIYFHVILDIAIFMQCLSKLEWISNGKK